MIELKKAKEYAGVIQSASSPEEMENMVVQCMQELFLEVKQLAKQRNIQTDSGMVAILKEQDRKWKAICHRVNTQTKEYLREDGFMELMKRHVPETEKLLMKERMSR